MQQCRHERRHGRCKDHVQGLSKRLRHLLDVLAGDSGRERLGQLLGLHGILDDEGVEVAGAADLELGGSLGLLDLHRLGVLAARLLQEVTDITDLLGHFVCWMCLR